MGFFSGFSFILFHIYLIRNYFLLHPVCGLYLYPSVSVFYSYIYIYSVDLKQIGPIAPNWVRTAVIYSWLFKYTQQHTVGFTENSIGPHTSYGGPCIFYMNIVSIKNVYIYILYVYIFPI